MGGLRSAPGDGRDAEATGDEFDAGRLKGATEIHKGPTVGSSLAALEVSQGCRRHLGSRSQFIARPPKHGSCPSALFRGYVVFI
jgi:hypothetical protein